MALELLAASDDIIILDCSAEEIIQIVPDFDKKALLHDDEKEDDSDQRDRAHLLESLVDHWSDSFCCWLNLQIRLLGDRKGATRSHHEYR
jgi:hypothetical protein